MSTSFLGPYFSYPYNADGEVEKLLMDASVHQRLVDLYNGVLASTVIRGAFYIWLYEDFGRDQQHMRGPVVSSPKLFTQHVATSQARSGVRDAHYIVDRKYMDSETRDAFVRLNISVIEDANSQGGGGIMHCKFVTFSALSFPSDGVPSGYPRQMNNVVAVLSANIDNAMYRAANNLLIMYGNEALYKTFIDIWNYIRTHPEADVANSKSERCDDVHVWSFPCSDDTIVRILDKTADQMRPGRPTTVRVAMYLFGRQQIRDKLISLAERGADVKIVLTSYSHKGDPENRALDNEFDERGVGARLLPNRSVGVMHSKYLLVDADYELQNEVERRKLVWTGSHNYTSRALEKNDEILIRVDDPDVYRAYLTDWNRLWNLAG